MQLPNWLKIVWWLIVVGVLSYFLRERLPDLLSGKAAAADIAVFGVWAALLLAPLFTEVTLLGVTLKNEIEELKGNIAAQFSEVKAEVRNAIDVRASINQVFHQPAPPPDAQLPELEARIKATVAAAIAEQDDRRMVKDEALAVDNDISFLFATRYHIESEMRRIASGRELVSLQRRTIPIHLLSRSLVESGLLDPRLGSAIREVYSVCSPAIHGEPVTDAQVAFVKDVGPELVQALRAIK